MPNNTIQPVLLLATFNGETYLNHMLCSLSNQEALAEEALLVVSDDHSTDNTISSIKSFESSPVALRQITEQNSTPWSGAVGNFAHLCHLATTTSGTHFFFCDQDDLWLPNKVITSLERMDDLLDGATRNDLPALVFSDLEVIDREENHVAQSFANYQGLPPPGEQPLHRLLHQNVVTGCTVCFNRPLLELASPIPRSALMHDHWFGLCARVFGKWSYIDEPLVKYRQHGENAVGAKSAVDLRSWLRADIYTMLFNYPFHLAQAVEQAEALKSRMLEHPELISEDDLSTVDAFAGLRRIGLFDRWKIGMRFFDGKRSLGERTFLLFVLAIIPWVKVQR